MAKQTRAPGQSSGRRNPYQTGERSRRDINAYYQYSSEAYELAPLPEEYEEDAAPQRRKKIKKLTRKQRVKRIRKRNAPKYVYEKQQERKLSASTLITAALLFGGVLLYLLTFSLTAVGQQQVDMMNYELSELREDNAALKNGMYDSAELERIKAVAVTKLGMVVPEEHQKVYIDVPKQSYFVQNELDTAKQETEASFDLFGLFATQ